MYLTARHRIARTYTVFFLYEADRVGLPINNRFQGYDRVLILYALYKHDNQLFSVLTDVKLHN